MAATGIHDRFEVLRGRLGIRCGVVRDGIRHMLRFGLRHAASIFGVQVACWQAKFAHHFCYLSLPCALPVPQSTGQFSWQTSKADGSTNDSMILQSSNRYDGSEDLWKLANGEPFIELWSIGVSSYSKQIWHNPALSCFAVHVWLNMFGEYPGPPSLPAWTAKRSTSSTARCGWRPYLRNQDSPFHICLNRLLEDDRIAAKVQARNRRSKNPPASP